MPSSERPSDPQAAYAIQRALVDLQMAEIERLLQAHEAVRPIEWIRVGDLEHVEVSLANLVNFLMRR